MNLRLLVPIALGVCSVIQAGLNRRAAMQFDFSGATLLNSAVLFALSAIFFFMSVRKQGGLSFSETVEIWNFIPGLLGICLVAGIPWAISKWGTTTVFVGVMTSQVLASLVWDFAVEKRPLGPAQLSGAVLSIVSMVFVNR